MIKYKEKINLFKIIFIIIFILCDFFANKYRRANFKGKFMDWFLVSGFLFLVVCFSFITQHIERTTRNRLYICKINELQWISRK